MEDSAFRDKVFEFMGATRADLDAAKATLVEERATRVARSDATAAELNRRFEEHQRDQAAEFAQVNANIGQLAKELRDHLLMCKGHGNEETSWRDRKVAAGAGGGAGIVMLIEAARHWLSGK